jgi:hypothetical protein
VELVSQLPSNGNRHLPSPTGLLVTVDPRIIEQCPGRALNVPTTVADDVAGGGRRVRDRGGRAVPEDGRGAVEGGGLGWRGAARRKRVEPSASAAATPPVATRSGDTTVARRPRVMAGSSISGPAAACGVRTPTVSRSPVTTAGAARGGPCRRDRPGARRAFRPRPARCG